ncbi:MAG: HlyD family efflux transporter periplasmic adaptor subunit [Cyanobacteriota bacterium ELA615]
MTSNSASKKGKIIRLLPILLLILGVGWLVKTYILSSKANQPLELSGRIEGYETDIGAKVGGRVDYIKVREGDQIKKGELLAQLEDTQIKAQLEGAKAQIDSYKQKENQALWQIDVINRQIEQEQLSKKQSVDDSLGRVNQATSSVTAAQSQLAVAKAQQAQSQSALKLAKADLDRYSTLIKEQVITRQQYEQALNRWENSQAEVNSRLAAVEAARKQINVAQGSLVQARSSRFNPDISQARLLSLQTQLKQTQSQLNGAKAELENAKANQKQIQVQQKDLKIYSPLDGVVITRNAEPGQVVAVGKTILSAVNLEDLYMRGFIAEGQIGRVKVGQKAEVYLDSDPKHPLKAKVTEVDSKASFTPENIYFKEDRVKQVFGVKLGLLEGGGYAKPGMPADAKILEQSTNHD